MCLAFSVLSIVHILIRIPVALFLLLLDFFLNITQHYVSQVSSNYIHWLNIFFPKGKLLQDKIVDSYVFSNFWLL